MAFITLEIPDEELKVLSDSADLLDGLFTPGEIAAVIISAHLKTETADDIKEDILDGLQDLTETATA